MQRGFSFVEVLISIGIFLGLSIVVYQTTAILFKGTRLNREQTVLAAVANEHLEIARNLPYSSVGTIAGNPNGPLPDEPNAKTVTIDNDTYSVFYEITYIDNPADGTIILGTDPAPNDYKQVKLQIRNNQTNVLSTFITTVVPQGLEGLSSGGALSIQVIDATGAPVPNATITILNTTLNPTINLTRTTDADGKWIEVGLPTSTNSYSVSATKSGHSTDSTYPITQSNPNPTKPHATILNGQVTALSFAIDLLSNLTFETVSTTCSPISGVPLQVQGEKRIGENPIIYKFDNQYTSNGSGEVVLSNIEWDTYTPTIGGTTYMIYGSSPIQRIELLPNTSQTFRLMLGPKTNYSLLVIVKDAATGGSIEGAAVTLSTTNPTSSVTDYTGGSQYTQENWTGGSGQTDYTDTTKYFSDDGHISTTEMPIGVRLVKSGGQTIFTDGWLISSSFDMGSPNPSYTTLTWEPPSQIPNTRAYLQLASNDDNQTWNFVGPDGTANTVYETPGATIASIHNGDQFMRYKIYLETTKNRAHPVVTSVTINYVGGACFTPGQVIFTGLSNGKTYDIEVSMAGYQTELVQGISLTGNNTIEVFLEQ